MLRKTQPDDDTIVAILGRLGYITQEQVDALSARCTRCTGDRQCGDGCPADALGVRMALSHGWISERQLRCASELQAEMLSGDVMRSWQAHHSVAVHAARERRQSTQRLNVTAGRLTRKTADKGYPAVKVPIDQTG